MANYIRKDIEGGVLTESNEISVYKRTQFIEMLENKLLGDYNKKGEYVVEENIVRELIALKKVKTYTYGNSVFCQSIMNVGGFGRIDFAIKLITDVDSAKCVAHLELLENISKVNGYYSNTNAVLIATFSSSKFNTFARDCFTAFNVVDTTEGSKIEDDFEPETIIARKKYIEWLKVQLDPQLIRLEKDMLDKRLKVLKRSDVGKKIYNEFLNEILKLKGIYIKEQSQSYFRCANEILDRLFQLRRNEMLADKRLMLELSKIGLDVANKTENIVLNLDENYLKNTKTPKHINLSEKVAEETEKDTKQQINVGSYKEERIAKAETQKGPQKVEPVKTVSSGRKIVEEKEREQQPEEEFLGDVSFDPSALATDLDNVADSVIEEVNQA